MSHYSKKQGLPPGSLIYTGKDNSKKIEIETINYSHELLLEEKISNITDLKYEKDSKSVYWININGVHNTELLKTLGEKFIIHNLVLEDILNTTQRPKVEFFDDHIFLVIKMLSYNNKEAEIDSEQVSFILGHNYVISFQEKPGDVFDPLRNRIKNSSGKVRNLGSDYLAFALLDIIIDNYFILLEHLGEKLEKYEESLIKKADKEILNRIYFLKRENLLLRNSVWPVRELVSQLEKSDSGIIKKKTIIYFRNLYDHTIQVIDSVEIYRDLLSGLIELYMTGTSNKTNEVMKVLTIISTIFIPLTFIAGIYGMNFKYMPELGWHWAYFSVWGVMLILTILMLWFFRRKKWL
jgi:magnesium transporter